MNKKIKLVLIFIITIIIIFCLIIFPSITNNHYQKNTISILENKANIKIKNINKHNNYLIATTNKEIIVYNNNYKEIFKENIDKTIKLNYDIIYKKGSLMYEETILSKNKVTYNYYDIYSGDKIDSLEIEGKNDR